MGLSRKLGGGTSSRAEVPMHVDYTWSTQAYTIQEILTKFRLPCVVQCSGDPGPVLWDDFRFDMRQPLLLHAARTVRKIHARSLQIVEPRGQLEEFGPPLAVPEDYDGWFFPVGRNQDPETLPRHTRVEGVADSPSTQFLVTTTLPAFASTEGSSSAGSKHVQHEVSIGEVLTKVGVVKGDPSVASSSPTALIQRARQSLRCRDENQHEVILPFHHRALLFDVAHNYGPAAGPGALEGAGEIQTANPTSPGVVHTQTIISVGNKYLPRVFRHVLGELPALVQTFTGLLRFYSVFTEETVMAATMSRAGLYSMAQESSCLELATDSVAKFRIALNASDLKKSSQYAQALKTCEEQAPSYVRAIKTSFTVQPVMSELDDMDLSLYDGGEEGFQGSQKPEEGSAKAFEAMQTQSVTAEVSHECSFSGVIQLDREGGATDSCDSRDPVQTEDGGEDGTVTADHIPNPAVDTGSLSDATDVLCSDGVSDAGDVEANSEFDFTWGRLKRARSYSGSVSSVTDDSDTSSTVTESDSEDSVVARDDSESSPSPDSTLTKDTISSASEDTVVLRASAPSPVYANVPKALSVYRSEQSGDASCDAQSSEMPNTAGRGSTAVQGEDLTVTDRSVRSVWNLTPTSDGQQGQAQNLTGGDSVPPRLSRDEDRDTKTPIWWGDATDNGSAPESHSSTLERPSSIAQKSSAASKQAAECVASPGEGRPGLQSAAAPHSLQSSRLSVRSEGSAQDLAIQRLERALNDATYFLKSAQPQSDPQPLPPARRGKADYVNVSQIDDMSSPQGDDTQDWVQLSTPVDSGGQRSFPLTGSVKGSSRIGHNGPTVSGPDHFLADHHTVASADRQALCSDEHQMPANTSSRFGSDYCSQQTQGTQEQTDWYAGSDPALQQQQQAMTVQEEGQVDVDFVKALGDRLLAVSRKSSLPKYQRLQPDMEASLQADDEDGGHPFRKKKQRGGVAPRYTAQHGTPAATSHDGTNPGDFGSVNADEAKDWQYRGSTRNDAILTDLDLLQEEVV